MKAFNPTNILKATASESNTKARILLIIDMMLKRKCMSTDVYYAMQRIVPAIKRMPKTLQHKHVAQIVDAIDNLGGYCEIYKDAQKTIDSARVAIHCLACAVCMAQHSR